MLNSISPIDGRYALKTNELKDYFSEYALIKYRVFVELEYLIKLIQTNPGFQIDTKTVSVEKIINIFTEFSEEDALKIKEIESITNHDVKAVEYFIKDKLKDIGSENILEMVHFGLTSQDINNTAFPLMIKDAVIKVMQPAIQKIIDDLQNLATEYHGIPMLARTHGQAASPTTVGKEIRVFIERLQFQLTKLKKHEYYAKFGGATGNLNAHKVCFSDLDWIDWSNTFIEKMGLRRHQTTTQIAHYDDLAELCQLFIRVNTILIDLARDMWSYISMDYFKQKVVANEVGSSAMPHKVNPIDFENAEGNLGIANAIFEYLAKKLPVSRLQRDLTDSTVLRNIGVPFAHSLIAYQSLCKGISKIHLNEEALNKDLNANVAVVAEAIQNILRKINYPEPYEKLKELTRGKSSLNQRDIEYFIDSLAISESEKSELLKITPFNYTGYQ
jgi:adenylosuccinate lyase